MKIWFALGCVLAGLGVATGAFGAHSLRRTLPPEWLVIFETGVRYQMYHALGLVAVAWASSRWSSNFIHIAGWLFLTGILLFSGSLYALCLTGVRGLGMLTPVGGICFLVGWGVLAWGVATTVSN
jgi:uncharacterized membrane protein YgdD (TMEM256/DUF423 family)